MADIEQKACFCLQHFPIINQVGTPVTNTNTRFNPFQVRTVTKNLEIHRATSQKRDQNKIIDIKFHTPTPIFKQIFKLVNRFFFRLIRSKSNVSKI